MLKNLFSTLLIIFITLVQFNCSDSDDFRRRMSPQERAAQLKEKLDLTDAQAKQIEEIYVDFQDRMAENRDKFQGDREQMRQLMLENREKTELKIVEILTDEQRIKYEEYREEREAQRRERMQGRRER